MGAQQILLIVLSIVIVAITVTVGITIFINQSKNSAKQAIIADMNNFAMVTLSFFKTPTIMGGSSYGTEYWTSRYLAKYIGTGYIGPNFLSTENAVYSVSIEEYIVTFNTASSNELIDPAPILKINCKTGKIKISTNGINPADPT